MKRIKYLLTALLMLCCSVAQADYFEVDGVRYYYYYWSSSKTVSVQAKETGKYSGEVIIPSTVTYNGTTYNVTSIGSSAFSDCSSLTSVTIPEGVTSIGSYAFYGCSSLTSINLPSTLTSIGNGAFENCISLTSVTIPEGVTSIGSDAFENCSSLTSVTIPEGVTSIEYGVFSGCSSLTSVTIPEGVTSLGWGTFYNCTSLVDVIFPSTLLSIDTSAFDGCTALKDVEENGVLYRGGNWAIGVTDKSKTSYILREGTIALMGTFSECEKLENIVLPKGLKVIGENAFNGCASLAAIDIPDSVKRLDNASFRNCYQLRIINIGKCVEEISSGVFDYCYNLDSICVAPENLFFDSREDCNAIIRTSENELVVATNNTVIPSTVTKIGCFAFSASKTEGILIPRSVTEVSSGAFYNSNIYYVYLGHSNIEFDEYDSYSHITLCTPANVDCSRFLEKFGNRVEARTCGPSTFCFYSNYNTTVAGTGRVEDLYDNMNDYSYGYLSFSQGITHIGSHIVTSKACYGVSLPESLRSIDSYAFSGIWGVTNVTIPKNVERIGTAIFTEYNTPGLEYLDVDTLNPYYDSRGNCNAIIDSRTNELVLGCKTTKIPDGVVSIAPGAFKWCGELKEISIPNSVTSIGDEAFSGCDGLTEITIPNSVTSIGDGVFAHCRGIYRVIIPDNVTTIGSNSFEYCSQLLNISIPESVVSIGDNAFRDCSNLRDIEMLSNTPPIIQKASLPFSKVNIYIPENSYEAYKSADVWKDNLNSIVRYDYAHRMVNVTASDNKSSVLVALAHGDNDGEVMASKVYDLKVCGTINSYDMIVLRDKMPNLAKLDLSEARVVPSRHPYYNGVCTKEDDLGSYAFCNETRLRIIKLPAGLKSIGSNAFKGCAYLEKLLIPESVISIGSSPFEGCVVLDSLYLPNSVTDISSYAFYNFKGVVNIPQNIQSIGSRAFYETKLVDIKLPNTLINLGTEAFYNCKHARIIEIGNGLKTISSSAFSGCSAATKIVVGDAVESIGSSAFSGCSAATKIVVGDAVETIDSRAFNDCYAAKEIVLGENVKSIGDYAFYNCDSLKTISFPVSLETIGSSAFYGCSSLETVSLPSSLRSIGSSAFSGCNNITGVYTHTVEPTEITESTFSVYSTATLYVPSVSYWTYYYGSSGWKNFLKLAKYDKPYEYLYSKGDNVFDEETGYPNGENGVNPDMDMDNSSGLVVDGKQEDNEEPNMNLGDVNVNHDGDKNSGSIIGDNNLHVDKLNIKIKVTGNKWYFFSFPFDVEIANISLKNGSHYVFRYYDGELRASGKSGWVNFTGNVLKAGKGYAFQCSASDELNVQILDIRFKKDDKLNEILAYISSNLKDASWNFMGNPFLSYYDINDMDYSAPITVWNGSSYVAVRPGDDDYHLAPTQAFFVQKPEGKENIRFQGDKQMTGKQSREKLAEANQSRMLVSESVEKNERLLINLVLSDEKSSDQTRVVFNENQSMGYETTCDAAKFDAEGVVQLYTLDATKVRYAINERPVDKGVVPVGFSVPAKGTYTIEAKRMDTPVFLKDNVTGVLHDLSQGAYTFSAEAGGSETRFQIVTKDTVTAIGEVDAEEDGETVIYDMSGRRVKKASHGVFVINGEKSVEK